MSIPLALPLPSQSPRLDDLLSKLRPFQRAAYEFATRGVPLPSPDDDDDEDDEVEVASRRAKKMGGVEGGKKKNKKRNRGREQRRRGAGAVSLDDGTAAVAGAGTGRILLGDEMGLGKTLTSLAIALAYQRTEWPLLILCPASLRYTWPTEIEKWCPWIPSQSIHVARGADDVHFASQIRRWRSENRKRQTNSTHNGVEKEEEGRTTKRCPVQIVVVTYSLLQRRFQVADALRECEFECVIADESHNLKQPSSQRCELALPILQNSKRLVLLSGTPALNRPVELWPQLHALDRRGLLFGEGGMKYSEYTKRYCNARRTRFGYDVKGSSNADELHERLRSVMVRRLKNDVLRDLPAKQRAVVPVEITDKEKEREGRETMAQLGMARKAVREITELDADEVANSAQWEARKLLMQAYQASGVAKAPATTEYILDWLSGSDPTQKLVVFAHHKEVLDYIEETVSKRHKGRLGTMRIDGSVPPAERALRVKKFQSNAKVRLALLSMTAAGVGLTLTAASNIIFAELHWTPGVLAQAEDRCHRIGQANSVNVMYCICKDEEVSVDTDLWSMLGRKVGNLGRVVDGERGKGLNAVERNAEASSSGGSGGKEIVSVEEELSSFFASSTVSTGGGKPNKGQVVKGTIQSFFKKQVKKSESVGREGSSASGIKGNTPTSKVACVSLLEGKQPKKSIPASSKPILIHKKKISKSNVACISLLDDDDDDHEIYAVEAKSKKKRTRPDVASKATFACQTCTFENRGDATACAMCGASRSIPEPSADEGAEPESELPSPSARKWSCGACTYVNRNDAMRCGMCREERQSEGPGKDDAVGKTPDVHGNCSTGEEIEFEEDEEWNEEDLAAIDAMSQNYTQVSSSVSLSPDSTTQSPVTLQKDCMSRKCTRKEKVRQHEPTDILSFSVSRNSGRIALHLSSSGQLLAANFDVPQVLTKESADRLENMNLSRKVPNSTFSQPEQELSFDDGSIRKVLAQLGDDSTNPAALPFQEKMQCMCNELKHFVNCYLNLREVEKKALKESGEAIAAKDLKQTVAKLLVSTVTGTTERYSGGAKERAILNAKNNCATAADQAVIDGKACAWCAKPFLHSNKSIATYCSQACAEEGRLKRGGIYASTRIRERLFALEHGVCTKCGIDAHELFCKMKALHPAERLNALLNAKWKLPQTRQATDRLLNDPKESDFWQADHELAVAEGGGSTGLDNLRTLCTPCHGVETEKLFARLKTMPNQQPDGPSKDGRTQMDIMSCFSQMNDSSGKKKRKRRRAAD